MMESSSSKQTAGRRLFIYSTLRIVTKRVWLIRIYFIFSAPNTLNISSKIRQACHSHRRLSKKKKKKNSENLANITITGIFL